MARDEAREREETENRAATLAPHRFVLRRTVALIGLMGAGKSSIGRALAQRLGARFRDADDEIQRAAAMPIPEIFERFGEPYFRDGERRVIARLLRERPHVLATGGGAYMDAETRAALKARAFTIWLRADLETLVERCGRRSGRPLLDGQDIRAKLSELMTARHPRYAEADHVIESRQAPHEDVISALLIDLEQRKLIERVHTT